MRVPKAPTYQERWRRTCLAGTFLVLNTGNEGAKGTNLPGALAAFTCLAGTFLVLNTGNEGAKGTNLPGASAAFLRWARAGFFEVPPMRVPKAPTWQAPQASVQRRRRCSGSRHQFHFLLKYGPAAGSPAEVEAAKPPQSAPQASVQRLLFISHAPSRLGGRFRRCRRLGRRTRSCRGIRAALRGRHA